MSSNLKVNTVLPSVGTAIGIGTAGGSVSITSDTITALTGGSERIRIASDGSFAVGTTSPDSALHVYKQINDRTARFQRISSQHIDITQTSGINSFSSTGKNFEIGTTDSQDLIFDTAGVERLRINTSGRLGLNTNSPDMTFTIKGGGDAQMSLKNTSGTTKAYFGTAGAFGSAGTDDLRIRSDSSNIVF